LKPDQLTSKALQNTSKKVLNPLLPGWPNGMPLRITPLRGNKGTLFDS